MFNVVLSLILAGGAATFLYLRLSQKVGYGNTQSLLGVVSATFIIVFIVVLTLLFFVLQI